jgi:hypothetical protein
LGRAAVTAAGRREPVVDRVLALHRAAGNEAVGRLLTVQRLTDLLAFAPNEKITVSGWSGYVFIGSGQLHISIYTSPNLTTAQRKWILKRTQRDEKTGEAVKAPLVHEVPPPPLAFNEFHITIKAVHHFYSDAGTIIVKAGPSHAGLDDKSWAQANKGAAWVLKKLGVNVGVEQLNQQLETLRTAPRGPVVPVPTLLVPQTPLVQPPAVQAPATVPTGPTGQGWLSVHHQPSPAPGDFHVSGPGPGKTFVKQQLPPPGQQSAVTPNTEQHTETADVEMDTSAELDDPLDL